jgi:hypothetical protein
MSEVLQKNILTRIVRQWRIAAILFGVVLTAAWLALLAWLFLQLV